jgi:hypothetical protein
VRNQTRRDFVVYAGALATVPILGPEQQASAATPPLQADAAGLDPVAQLNLQFRSLYGSNRQELWEATPLAALTLIGTGEIWRVERGQVVKSYTPTPWIAKVKGIMHAVIGTQATWARLRRGKSLVTNRQPVADLAAGLADCVKTAANDLPPEVALSARAVLQPLRDLAAGWAAGKAADSGDFPAMMNRVQPALKKVLDAAGEAVYASIVKNLRTLAAESNPQEWERCLVGVCGVGFARRDNVEIAAAMSVMGKNSVGTRLLYLENAFTISAGMTQLAGALADRDLGQAVFGDPYRMWRDLLGDVAARHAGGGFFPEMGKP